MIENLKNIADRNTKLEKMSDKDLNAMYLRVFSTADGELVMQDLASRVYVYEHTNSEFEEGMRATWLSIQSRLQGAVAPTKGE